MAQLGTLPPELFEQQQDVSRQQRMAQMLMQQGMQTPQGQIVGGRYVPPSIFQNLANLANVYVGTQLEKEADKKQLEMAQRLREGQSKAVKEYFEATQGSPEQITEMAGPYGKGMGEEGQNIPAPILYKPEKKPDFQQAIQIANDPYAPSWLKQNVAEMLKPQKVSEGERVIRFNPVTGKNEVVAEGGEKLTENQRNYLQAQKEGYQGTFFDYQRDLKKAGATNINMPTEGERKAGFMANILDKNIAQMQAALGVDPTAVKPNVPASIVAAIAGENVLSRAITPAQRQIIEDSQLDILDAALTLRTGAAYTREQLLGMRGTYFPRIGDSPETVKAKQARLETLITSAYIASGRATPERVSATPTAKPAAAPSGLPSQSAIDAEIARRQQGNK